MYPTLAAAIEYAQLGYRVLPLKPLSKIPALRHWPEEASNDLGVVRRHFAAAFLREGADNARHTLNVGIATGSGLVVVDVDTKHGGAAPDWMPDTLTVDTPSGGQHYYLAVDGLVPNSVGRIAPGVDVRGERGMVAAPPSRVTNHPSDGDWSGTYAWIDPERTIAHVDAFRVTPDDLRQDYTGRRASFEWRDEVPVGQRNNYLTSLAGHLFATGYDAADVMVELLAERDRLGFTPTRERELEKIVRSVARYHR